MERSATDWRLDGQDDLVATPEAVSYTAMLPGNVNALDQRTGKNTVLGRVRTGVNPILLTEAGTLLMGLALGPSWTCVHRKTGALRCCTAWRSTARGSHGLLS